MHTRAMELCLQSQPIHLREGRMDDYRIVKALKILENCGTGLLTVWKGTQTVHTFAGMNMTASMTALP